MNDFSIGQAAFSGYGLIKRQPMLWVVMALLGIAVSVGLALLAVTVAGPELTQMREINQARMSGAGGPPPDPQAMMASLGAIARYSLLAVLIGLVVSAVNAGAVNRAVVRPAASKFPYIGLLGDEFRLLVVTLSIAVLLFVPGVILGIIGQIIGVVVMIGTGGAGAMRQMGQGGKPPAALLTTVFTVYGLVGLIVFLAGVKFALAAAQTVAERGIRIFGSWQLTNGRYWKVVGTLLLGLVSLIPVFLVIAGVLFGVASATGEKLSSLSQPDYSSMAAIFTPLAIARYVLTGLGGALATIVLSSACANIYRAVVEGTEAGVFTDDDDDEDWDDEE